MEDPIWFAVGIVALVIFLNLVMPPPNNEQGYTGKRSKTWCPPHTWTKSGKYVCEVCGYSPKDSRS